ncbi:hypothetical protein [Myxococcus sp. RHSTA-1-4]|uniref:hypothetical protein n=1 Tax=Myxococcus sp. RHSTA-1-4 TaxID=2874601 RepID=UPI001CBB76CB|nr:hypothetical protein [Myxococcus sp. RHSTA-1-4]MBZ4423309.1 hypothetical protein [Myxococcus sp. RHSTA-1-4]
MTTPSFTLARTNTGYFEPLLVLVGVKDTSPGELTRAIDVWTSVLKLTGKQSVLRDEQLEDSDPWFGVGVRTAAGEVLDERGVFDALGRAETAPTEAFVRALIAFNRENTDALEGGLATHEELETGSAAVEWLVRQDLGQLELYLKFLESIDLEHTVEQVSVVLRLAEVYSAKQLAPLVKWAEENDASLLNDWLADERAWKER